MSSAPPVASAAADTAISAATRVKRKRSRLMAAGIGLVGLCVVGLVVHGYSSHGSPSVPARASHEIAQTPTPSAVVVPSAVQVAPSQVEPPATQPAALPTPPLGDLEADRTERQDVEPKDSSQRAHVGGGAKRRAAKRSGPSSAGSAKASAKGSWDPGF